MSNPSDHKGDFQELCSKLKSLGYYDEGMGVQEMRQLLQSLQISENQSEAVANIDTEPTITESVLDIVPAQNAPSLNTTTMSTEPKKPVRPKRSKRRTFDVKAQVHHAMDWEQPARNFQRKRSASTGGLIEKPSHFFDEEKKVARNGASLQDLINLRNVRNVTNNISQMRRIIHAERIMENADLIEFCDRAKSSTNLITSSSTNVATADTRDQQCVVTQIPVTSSSTNVATADTRDQQCVVTQIPVPLSTQVEDEDSSSGASCSSFNCLETKRRSPQCRNVSSSKKSKKKTKNLLQKIYSRKKV